MFSALLFITSEYETEPKYQARRKQLNTLQGRPSGDHGSSPAGLHHPRPKKNLPLNRLRPFLSGECGNQQPHLGDLCFLTQKKYQMGHTDPQRMESGHLELWKGHRSLWFTTTFQSNVCMIWCGGYVSLSATSHSSLELLPSVITQAAAPSI